MLAGVLELTPTPCNADLFITVHAARNRDFGGQDDASDGAGRFEALISDRTDGRCGAGSPTGTKARLSSWRFRGVDQPRCTTPAGAGAAGRSPSAHPAET